MPKKYIKVEFRLPAKKQINRKFMPKPTTITPEEIKKIRLRLRMTRRDLGRRLGVPPSGYAWETVKSWEYGKARPSPAVEKLIYYLGGKIDKI